MNTSTPFLVAACCYCFAACSPKLAPPAHYQATTVVADGLLNDWTLPLRFTNADYTLQYNITNDDKDIYICVLSRDEPTVLRILRAGVTLYFDPKGANNRDISLHYPLRKQPDPSIRDRAGEPSTTENDSSWKQELVHQSDSYGTTGFTGLENGQFGVGDTKSPIRVGMQLGKHDSLLVYEAVIPIANVLGAGYQSRSPKKPFSVGVVLNTPSGQRVVSGNRRGGGRGLGMGMNGMRFGGGRRNYGSSNDRLPLREDASWYQFRLASR